MNSLKAIYLFTILSISCLISAHAQLVGLNYDFVYQTSVFNKVNQDYDRIYTYKTTPYNIKSKRGALKAISPDTTDATFYWSRFDYTSKKYIFIGSVLGQSSILDTLTSGGFKVRVKTQTLDSTYCAWIFINKLQMSLKKDSFGYVPFGSYTCDYINLSVVPDNDKRSEEKLRYIQTKSFFYCDTAGVSKRLIEYSNPVTYLWTAEPEGVTEVKDKETKEIIREGATIKPFTFTSKKPQAFVYNDQLKTSNALGLNIKFTLKITDSFGDSVSDHVQYVNKKTMADFDIMSYDEEAKQFKLPKDTPIVEEAPLNVRFRNKSRNGFSFKWIITADTLDTKDSTKYVSIDSIGYLEHRYDLPKKYYTKLVSIANTCIDTSDARTIIVIDSKLGNKTARDAFPKQFNAENEFFINKAIKDTSNFASIKILNVKIYNQWGMLIYEFNRPEGTVWKGWNGTVKLGLGGGNAPPGLYYFAFYAEGYGKLNTSSSKFQNWDGGYFYLFRTK